MTGINPVRRKVAFSVPGAAVGKGRPKFARRGAFVTAYSDKKTVSYENLVKMYASEAVGNLPPFNGPVCLTLKISVMPPASWSKRKTSDALLGRVRPTTKPDIDNIMKSICDAMNEIVYVDDKQVCDVWVSKHYAATSEVRVLVEEL